MKINLPQCVTCTIRERTAFCDLATERLSRLENAKVSNAYKARQIIFHQGNSAHGVYAVYSGHVKVYAVAANGNQQIVRIAGPGDLIGLRCVISNAPYAVTAETIENAVICFIDRQTFFETMEAHSKTAFNVMALLAGEVRHAESQMINFAHKKVRERLAELFLFLNIRYGEKNGNGSTLSVALTREEIAGLIGTTQESVIRLMTEFRQDGLIAVDGRKVTISDFFRLTDIANFPD